MIQYIILSYYIYVVNKISQNQQNNRIPSHLEYGFVISYKNIFLVDFCYVFL